MKIYGIAKEYWDGYSYSCDFSEDIELYISKGKLDEQMAIYKSYKDTGDVIYKEFEV